MKPIEILAEIGIGIAALCLLVVVMPYAFGATVKEMWRYKRQEKLYLKKFQEENK